MTLQIQLIQGKALAKGDQAYTAIREHVSPEPALCFELLCWLCFCPPEALYQGRQRRRPLASAAGRA